MILSDSNQAQTTTTYRRHAPALPVKLNFQLNETEHVHVIDVFKPDFAVYTIMAPHTIS